MSPKQGAGSRQGIPHALRLPQLLFTMRSSASPLSISPAIMSSPVLPEHGETYRLPDGRTVWVVDLDDHDRMIYVHEQHEEDAWKVGHDTISYDEWPDAATQTDGPRDWEHVDLWCGGDTWTVGHPRRMMNGLAEFLRRQRRMEASEAAIAALHEQIRLVPGEKARIGALCDKSVQAITAALKQRSLTPRLRDALVACGHGVSKVIVISQPYNERDDKYPAGYSES